MLESIITVILVIFVVALYTSGAIYCLNEENEMRNRVIVGMYVILHTCILVEVVVLRIFWLIEFDINSTWMVVTSIIFAACWLGGFLHLCNTSLKKYDRDHNEGVFISSIIMSAVDIAIFAIIAVVAGLNLRYVFMIFAVVIFWGLVLISVVRLLVGYKNIEKKWGLKLVSLLLMIVISVAAMQDLKKIEVPDLEKRIKNKIRDVTRLSFKLEIKRNDITFQERKFQDGIGELESEILAIKKKERIRTYRAASKNRTIAYDLSLISTRIAYIQKLLEAHQRISEGIAELTYLERRARDDMDMVKVFGGAETEKIMKQINQTVEEYLPDAGKLVIEIDPETLISPEEIWNQITRRR